jgi:predicted nucleic acid-binding protein
MTAPVFVDTNILLYAHDRDAGEKGMRAASVVRQLWEAGTGVLSLQVLQELYVNLTRKIVKPLPAADARELVRTYGVWVRANPTVDIVLRAIEIGELARLSFWDGMIVASAEQAGAGELLTEDLNHGQVIGGVRIVNPFIAGAADKPGQG